MSRVILIASDGGRGSLGALAVGAKLQKESDLEVQVVAVVEPIPTPGPLIIAEYRHGHRLYNSMQAEEVRLALRRRLAEIGGRAVDWPVRVEVGNRAREIVRVGEEIGANAIVIGSGEHPPLDRWLGEETANQVTRLATVPVLAVPRGARELPSRVLIGIDFSDHSLRAARAALELIPRRSHLILAHVAWSGPEADSLPSLTEWTTTYRRGAEVRLREIGGHLRGELGHSVQCVVAAGDPGDELLSLARRLNADLIVAGSHGYGFLGRLIMGSVSTRLLRGAASSLMIVPPGTPADLAGAEMKGSTAAPVEGAPLARATP
jgi:nucleotide-binding universal stress UspA family protein